MRTYLTLRSAVTVLLYLVFGHVFLASYALGAGSAGSREPQAPTLLDTYVLLSTIATDRYEKRSDGYIPHIDRLNLAPEDRDRLVTLSVELHNKDLAYQRKRLSTMCARGNNIQDRERLGSEYAAYSADIQRNQEDLAQAALARLPQQERDALISWQTLWFTPNAKQSSASQLQAVMASMNSGLMQKFCDTLSTNN